MRALKFAAILALFGAIGSAFANGNACPPAQAAQAEAALSNVHNWSDAIDYFSRYKHCLDGGPSEGYTVFMAEQLAADRGVEQFWTATRRRVWFRPILAKRMGSEVISLETSEAILKNLRTCCPADAKRFCQGLTKRIRASCSACTP